MDGVRVPLHNMLRCTTQLAMLAGKEAKASLHEEEEEEE